MVEGDANLDKSVVALTAGGKTSRLLKNGDMIGDSYRLKGLIGRGGMGYVFRAEHIIIGREYALKMLAPDQINEVTWNRFQAEGKAIARLDHPNIVKIYNMGVDQGTFPYYVMDLLEGVALSDCIKDKVELSLDEILDIFIQLASGFGYAHGHGIIHRDVKPSNVMLVSGGSRYPTVKIVDFGIAKLAGAADLQGQSMTATGEVFGSPYYMSPEQCLGTEIDQRSDIYSLGCTLFETLCGRPPFQGESPVQTVMMHQNKPSPTLESVSGKYSSEEMEEIVAKMLMKRPAERYQSMDQLRHDLVRISERKAVGKSVPTGFKTSVDSQLEGMGSTYDQEQRSKARRRMILTIVSLVTIGFAAVVCLHIFQVASKPTATPSPVSISSHLSDKDYQSQAGKLALQLTKEGQILETTNSITSTTDNAAGTRVFHCPDAHIGSFMWRLKKQDPSMIEFAHSDRTRVEAMGDATVPATEPIWLLVDAVHNLDTMMHPDILTKFGPSELAGLCLSSTARMDEVGTELDAKQAKERATALVKAIGGWTNCQHVEFFSMPATDEALIELDKHKHLQQVLFRDSTFNAHVLAQRPFLQRLSVIHLMGIDDPDVVLSALGHSSALKVLFLGTTYVSKAGIDAIAKCPNLKVLVLYGCPIGTPELEALGRIKGLRRLQISGVSLKREQIPILLKFRNVEHLDLDLTGWPKPQRQQLSKLLPNMTTPIPVLQ